MSTRGGDGSSGGATPHPSLGALAGGSRSLRSRSRSQDPPRRSLASSLLGRHGPQRPERERAVEDEDEEHVDPGDQQIMQQLQQHLQRHTSAFARARAAHARTLADLERVRGVSSDLERQLVRAREREQEERRVHAREAAHLGGELGRAQQELGDSQRALAARGRDVARLTGELAEAEARAPKVCEICGDDKLGDMMAPRMLCGHGVTVCRDCAILAARAKMSDGSAPVCTVPGCRAPLTIFDLQHLDVGLVGEELERRALADRTSFR
jgi:hypothetical protein